MSDLNSAVEIIKEKVQDDKVREDILHYLNRVNDQYVEVRDILIRSANAGLNLGGIIHDMEKQVDALLSCINNDNFESVKSIAQDLEHIISGYTKGLPKEISKHLNNELKEGSIKAINQYNKVMGKNLKPNKIMNHSFFRTNGRKVNALIKVVNNKTDSSFT